MNVHRSGQRKHQELQPITPQLWVNSEDQKMPSPTANILAEEYPLYQRAKNTPFTKGWIQATCADKEVINWTNYFYDHWRSVKFLSAMESVQQSTELCATYTNNGSTMNLRIRSRDVLKSEKLEEEQYCKKNKQRCVEEWETWGRTILQEE